MSKILMLVLGILSISNITACGGSPDTTQLNSNDSELIQRQNSTVLTTTLIAAIL